MFLTWKTLDPDVPCTVPSTVPLPSPRVAPGGGTSCVVGVGKAPPNGGNKLDSFVCPFCGRKPVTLQAFCCPVCRFKLMDPFHAVLPLGKLGMEWPEGGLVPVFAF